MLSRVQSREPHTIDEDQMRNYFRTERWTVYASSTYEPKCFEVMVNGIGFRVTVRDVVIYQGQNASDAVRAYNEAV